MAIGVGALYWYVAHSLAPRESGSLTQNIATPPEYSKDLTNILVLGIDYDDNPEEQALGIQRRVVFLDFILQRLIALQDGVHTSHLT